ncbi:MAG TPA: PQQ-binding-like beta-propeller repeat protein [Planctomycetota bacterium]
MMSKTVALALLLALAGGDEKGSDRAPLGDPRFHPSAERPVGWRGDGSGRFPAATPPTEWHRRPKSAFVGLRSLGAKPKGAGAEGPPLNMGLVREWMIVGPFEAKDHAGAIEEIAAPNESVLQPAAGQKVLGKEWTGHSVSVTKQVGANGRLVLDFGQAYGKTEKLGAQNKPGTLEPLVAYAASYLFAPDALQARLRVQGQKLKAWINGAPVKIPAQYDPDPVVELRPGWNLLTVKSACTKEIWNLSATFTPSATSGYETRNIAWMAPMPGASWSSPIVVGPRIFVGADAGTLVCLNKADGRTLWTRSTTFYHAVAEEERAKVPDLAPKVQELDQMMLALPDDLNAALSVDGAAAEGNAALREKIKRKTDLERSIHAAMAKADRKKYDCWDNDRYTSTPTPASDGKHVFAAFWGGNKGIGANAVVCFDLEGRRIWTQFTGQTGIPEHGTHASPVLSGNHLIYLSGSTLFAYEKATGKVAWQKKKDTFPGASPVPLKLGGGDAVYVPQFGIFRSADGLELWKADVAPTIPTPVAADGAVYGLAEDTYFSFMLGADGKPSGMVKKPWKEISLRLGGTFADSVIGSPLYDGGLVYVASEGGALTVVEGRTGRQVYTKALDSLNPRLTWVFVVGICTGPTLAGKTIHIRDDQGQTIVIDRGPAYKELARNVLWELQTNGVQQESQSNPWYEGGRMYYRTQNFLYCVGER